MSARTARVLFFVFALLPVVLSSVDASAASPLTRKQALEALEKPNALSRRTAIARLAEVGEMSDSGILVEALRDADVNTRLLAENALWRVWSRSRDARVDRMFERGIAQMQRGETRNALSTFTRVIKLKPAFAEAWNKRATLYFLMGDYRKSLQDCAETVKRNPNHFGALAGYGQNYLRLNQPERALEYFQRALDVNPNMAGIEAAIEDLQEAIENKQDQSI